MKKLTKKDVLKYCLNSWADDLNKFRIACILGELYGHDIDTDAGLVRAYMTYNAIKN